MPDQFSDRAQLILTLAQDEARALGHCFIGTEHLLLGLAGDEDGPAVELLGAAGVTLDELRETVERLCGSGQRGRVGETPFTTHAQHVLELAQREARSLGYELIASEHLLLGLLREHEGACARVLVELGIDGRAARRELVRELSATRPRLAFPPVASAPTVPPRPLPATRIGDREWALLVRLRRGLNREQIAAEMGLLAVEVREMLEEVARVLTAL